MVVANTYWLLTLLCFGVGFTESDLSKLKDEANTTENTDFQLQQLSKDLFMIISFCY